MVECLTIGEASSQLGVSVDTLRRWAKLGLLRCSRDNRNRRIFSKADIQLAKWQHRCAHHSKPHFYILKSKETSYTTLELFAGAGGTALGLANAGFKNIFLNEIDADACQTLRINRPQWNVVEGDIHKLSFSRYKGKVDLLQGGVPCQAFSYSGLRRGFEDARGTLFFEYARAIREIQPKIIMMENVRGLLTHDHGKTLITMLNILMSEGYRVAIKVLHAQFLDVAQKRERLVILGVRKDLPYPILFPKQNGKLLTLWDAIGNCPHSEGAKYPKWKAEVLAQVPAGGYWKDLPINVQKTYLGKSFYLTGGKTGMARRLSWDEPSLTLTCSPAQKQTERCHPQETRPLTVREYARIQSFPDSWHFVGGMSSQYRQIGNAVPVNMAYHIGRSILSMLLQKDDPNTVKVAPLKPTDLSTEKLKKVALSFD